VRDHFEVDGDASGHPGGATLRAGDQAWFLADDRPARALGPALAWARQNGVGDLHVLAEGPDAGVLARRAPLFAEPPSVWTVDGRAVRPAEPAPVATVAELDPRLESFVRVIRAAGAEPVIEHGVLAGEVAGLEVVRAVADESGTRLEVGVGRHDREAFQLVHGDLPTADALAAVIRTVSEHRRPGAPPHPLNRLARERLLRERLLADPGLVGADRLEAVAPPVPRANVKEAVPAVAAGTDADGGSVLAVCSVGIDLDVVPFAADARLLHRADRLVIAVPERDDHPVTRALAGALREPAEVAPVPS
jgi:hypothetical protein